MHEPIAEVVDKIRADRPQIMPARCLGRHDLTLGADILRQCGRGSRALVVVNEPAIKRIPFVEVVIDAADGVIAEVVSRRCGAVDIVARRRPRIIGKRPQAQDLGRGGVEQTGRNCVVRKWNFCGRIDDRVGEDPIALVLRRNLPNRRVARGRLAIAFVISEKQQLVPPHRTTQRGAVLIALQRADAGGEKRAGVHKVISEELIGRAMKSVGPAARDKVDDRPAAPAEFGGRHAGLDAELGNGVHRRCNAEAVAPGFLVINPVDLIIVLFGTGAASGRHRRAARRFRGPVVTRGRRGERNQERKLHELPDAQRQVLNLLAVDHLAAGARLALEKRSLRGDLDHFLHFAHLQYQLDANRRLHINPQPGSQGSLKSWHGRDQLVGAGGEQRRAKFSRGIRLHLAFEAGIRISNRDGSIRDRAAAGICDDTGDSSGRVLRQSG